MFLLAFGSLMVNASDSVVNVVNGIKSSTFPQIIFKGHSELNTFLNPLSNMSGLSMFNYGIQDLLCSMV
jgi:hypothetical protein